MNSDEIRISFGIGIIFALRILGMAIIFPVISIYGIHLRDANNFLIGLTVGIYGLTQAILQIPFGIASDRFGRKPLIILGLLIFFIGSMIAALTDSIYGIILGRALQGSGAISSVMMALLTDCIYEKNRTKSMAFIGISIGIAFFISIILGPVITNYFGFHSIFLIIALCSIFGIIIVLTLLPNRRNVRSFYPSSYSYKEDISNKEIPLQIFTLNLSILFLHCILSSNFLLLPTMMINLGIQSSFQWMIYFIVIIIAFILWTPLILFYEKRYSSRIIMLVCILLLSIAESMFLYVSSYIGWFFIGLQFFFLSFIVMESFIPSLLSKYSSLGIHTGRNMGIYSTSQFIGSALGGILGGWLMELRGNFHSILLMNILICLIWLGIIILNKTSKI
ncbi:MFS transporter [Candidatus Schneideria nysicola]|uniref:MFS transporter n=1 Tax=Candidatus Schneideria nysicola TaxID=1081631 RepID=UPI001CAA41C6|nr:MFS transporter [Candidatus Schneideria nysicola]UAJ64913.1 MFS transporter [Candidatus Schneideria nysicola]